jgi:hypothetical protein
MQAAIAERAVPAPVARFGAAKQHCGSFKQSVRGTRVQHKARKLAGQHGLLQQG